MKKLISLFMIFMTFSCGDECEPIKDNRDDGSIKLNLVNPDSIRLWCRSVCSFDAVSEGNYSIESQDTSVMKASVQGNHFTVRSLRTGEANVIITNSLGNRKVLHCRSFDFAGRWSEAPELGSIYNNTWMVVVNDSHVSELIRDELTSCLNRGYEYRFMSDSDEMTVWNPLQEALQKGTYRFDVSTLMLTLEYGNVHERYFCGILPPYPNLSNNPPSFIVELKQDLTEKYAAQYPHAGVSDVYIIRYMIALDIYWLIDTKQ